MNRHEPFPAPTECEDMDQHAPHWARSELDEYPPMYECPGRLAPVVTEYERGAADGDKAKRDALAEYVNAAADLDAATDRFRDALDALRDLGLDLGTPD